MQAAKTGMLASAEIIATVAADLARASARTVPLVVDPVCASMHGDPLLRPPAHWIRFATELFPLATLVTPNLDEVRLLVDIEVVDPRSQREAARALHALGPQWALVKGGHLRVVGQQHRSAVRRHRLPRVRAPRMDTGHDHGAGDTLAAATACALAHGFTVPDAVGVRASAG